MSRTPSPNEAREAVEAAVKPAAGPAGPHASEGYSRRLVLTAASQIKPRPVYWGWQDRLPAGHVSMIAGREGIGKSLLLAWMIAQVARGLLPGIYPGTPRAVFCCATEDSWQHTIVPRLIAAGADLELVYRIDVEMVEATAGDTFRVELTMPRDCDLLAAEVKRLEVALIALDPLMSAVDRTVDTNNDREMRTVLEPLARLADDTSCTVVGLGHFNKSASADPLNLLMGSRAFAAVVRAVLAAARDPEAADGSCVLSQVKNNLGRLDQPHPHLRHPSAVVATDEGDAHVGKLHFTGDSARSVSDILAEMTNPADRTERAECGEWLRQELTDGPKRTKEVEAAGRERGFSQRTQWRARKQLGIKAEQMATGTQGRNQWWLSLDQAGSDELA
jgi:hypothetical protein